MNEIAMRARLGRLPPLLAKAKTLLTNFWARSDWTARAELIPVARMLVVLGAAQPALKPSANAAPPAPRAGKSKACPPKKKAIT
jgi:hypothetical protein